MHAYGTYSSTWTADQTADDPSCQSHKQKGEPVGRRRRIWKVNPKKAPSMTISPWAKLRMPMAFQMRTWPRATKHTCCDGKPGNHLLHAELPFCHSLFSGNTEAGRGGIPEAIGVRNLNLPVA